MTDFNAVLAAFLTGGVCLKGIQISEAWWARRVKKLSLQKQVLTHLCGLPDEMKAVLIHFYINGTHTLRGDPSDPAVRELIRSGVLVRGGGGGTYDAVNSYITVRSDIWEVIQTKWLTKDPSLVRLIAEREEQPE